MTFGERLKFLRTSRKVYQKDIAAYLGITLRGYQFYEADSKEPNIDGLRRLADYFDVSVDYLIGRSDDPARR